MKVENIRNRTLGVMITLYPPGIPFVMPSEKMSGGTEPIIHYLLALQTFGQRAPEFEHELLIAAVCYVTSCTVIMGLVPHSKLVNSASSFVDTVWRACRKDGTSLKHHSLFRFHFWLAQTEVGAPKAGARQELFPAFFAKVN
ncbi:hypothetical protein KW813_11890 [Enterobacter quasiroggenkampii]|nr:hypothetical protein [Enterobacter quasiroggenkampii]